MQFCKVYVGLGNFVNVLIGLDQRTKVWVSLLRFGSVY